MTWRGRVLLTWALMGAASWVGAILMGVALFHGLKALLGAMR